MANLVDLASTDRNPMQEQDYQTQLKSANIPFTIENGKANVQGFGIGGNGTGDQAQSFFDPTNLASRQNQTNFGNLVASNTKAVTDFLGNYKTDVATAQDTANTKFNVPTFENLVTGLNSRINDLEFNTSNSGGGSVGATGAGGFSTMGQVDTALSSRYLPQLNTAQQNLGTAAGLAQTYVGQALQPDQAYATLLANNIDTAMSGLTATQQTQMQGIIAKLNAGVALTTAEINAGEAYAATVLNNANSITLEKIRAAYTPIGAGSTLINPNTGTIINPGILAASGSFTP
ncbi:MAG TPA: hypothetical protein VF941_11815 [Clostridia bacterium]